MNSYMNAMRRYFDFRGRSSRSEFWFFVLFYFIIAIIATVIDAVVLGSPLARASGSCQHRDARAPHPEHRRRHPPAARHGSQRLVDLIGFIPLIGVIWLIVLYCFESTPDTNRFGPRISSSMAPLQRRMPTGYGSSSTELDSTLIATGLPVSRDFVAASARRCACSPSRPLGEGFFFRVTASMKAASSRR